MDAQPRETGVLSPLFTEQELFFPLTPTELRAASRAMAFAYRAGSLPVATSNALASVHFKIKEGRADVQK